MCFAPISFGSRLGPEYLHASERIVLLLRHFSLCTSSQVSAGSSLFCHYTFTRITLLLYVYDPGDRQFSSLQVKDFAIEVDEYGSLKLSPAYIQQGHSVCFKFVRGDGNKYKLKDFQ